MGWSKTRGIRWLPDTAKVLKSRLHLLMSCHVWLLVWLTLFRWSSATRNDRDLVINLRVMRWIVALHSNFVTYTQDEPKKSWKGKVAQILISLKRKKRRRKICALFRSFLPSSYTQFPCYIIFHIIHTYNKLKINEWFRKKYKTESLFIIDLFYFPKYFEVDYQFYHRKCIYIHVIPCYVYINLLI